MSGKGGKRSTSYGEKRGNDPSKAAKASGSGPGRPPATFPLRMKFLADLAARAKRWEAMLAEDQPDDRFFDAFDRVAPYAYSKASEKHEVTGADGGPISVTIIGGETIKFR